jgi:hypothetical protein
MHIVWSGHGEALNSALKRWASDRIWPGASKDFGDAVVMGVFDDQGPVGVVVLHDYNPEAGVIEFSGASTSRRWLTRPVLAAMFGYIFDGIGCQMTVCRTSADPAKQGHLHRILTAYGFDNVRVPRLGGRDEDLLVFTLTDDRWRSNKFQARAA